MGVYEFIIIYYCSFNVSTAINTRHIPIPVATPTRHECFRDKPIKVDGKAGYLSSVVTEETDAGTERCPWRIETGKGNSP